MTNEFRVISLGSNVMNGIRLGFLDLLVNTWEMDEELCFKDGKLVGKINNNSLIMEKIVDIFEYALESSNLH